MVSKLSISGPLIGIMRWIVLLDAEDGLFSFLVGRV